MRNLYLVFTVVAVFTLAGCTKGCNKGAQTTGSDATQVAPQAEQKPEAKVEIEDSVVGTGVEAVDGKTIVVHYTGTLKEGGTKFDSSLDRKEPFSFTLGAGQVIRGWDQGIKGMKKGGKRKLTIPAELGYGANAVGAIPANSALVFEVELLDVK